MTDLSRRTLIASGLAASAATAAPTFAATQVAAPKPWGATPSTRQLAWHKRERYAFVHFSINTFTGRPWTKNWISHADLMKGGRLVFTMSKTPVKTFGQAKADRPPSNGRQLA